MDARPVGVGAWLRRRAENVVALLLGAMFVAFILQIVFRYFLNWPTGWTTELTVVTWLWMVLWGAAFVLKDSEEIRFDLVYSSVRPRARRAMVVIVALAVIGLYLLSLPASWSYVTFMKVERSSYLRIRLDHLYSIYVIFLVAIVVRYAWLIWQVLRGHDPAQTAVVGNEEARLP
jgi:TRAP-type C4-dicarboxylate transport system permease small subunit